MLYKAPTSSSTLRLQGAFVTSKEVEMITNYIKDVKKADYSKEISEKINNKKTVDIEEDELLYDALKVSAEYGHASASLLQRRLKLGYSRAARIIDQLEEKGLVSGYDGSKPREILVSDEELKKILENINLRAGGFYTEEIKENNRRVGFKIISLDNQEGILAHISIKNSRRVGRYGVNIYDLENIGVKCLNQALKDDDLILIDEIGKMEVFSEEFKEKVLDCLNSKKIVLATISIGGDKFISNIKRRDDIILFEITKENRNKLIEIISSLIFNFRKRF